MCGAKPPLRNIYRIRAPISAAPKFAGIKSEQEINDLWAYLKQFDAEGNIKK
jgi:hypothetical protein